MENSHIPDLKQTSPDVENGDYTWFYSLLNISVWLTCEQQPFYKDCLYIEIGQFRFEILLQILFYLVDYFSYYYFFYLIRLQSSVNDCINTSNKTTNAVLTLYVLFLSSWNSVNTLCRRPLHTIITDKCL